MPRPDQPGRPSEAIPVLSRRRPTVILAAIDLEPADDGAGGAAARRVLRTARSLAAWAATPPAALHVVHAWQLIGETVLACATRGLRPETFRTVITDAGRSRSRRVAEHVAHVLGGPPDGLHVVHGSARAAVPAVARRIGADIVVLGAREAGGMGRALLRGVAEAVADRSPSDLVIVGGRVDWESPGRPSGTESRPPSRLRCEARAP